MGVASELVEAPAHDSHCPQTRLLVELRSEQEGSTSPRFGEMSERQASLPPSQL
jgi:hypothetical protein